MQLREPSMIGGSPGALRYSFALVTDDKRFDDWARRDHDKATGMCAHKLNGKMPRPAGSLLGKPFGKHLKDDPGPLVGTELGS